MMRLLLLLMLVPGFAVGQYWAPIGAKWHYNTVYYCWGPGTDCGYFSMESIQDTVVQNQNAKLLKVEYFDIQVQHQPTYEIMYGDSDRVYHYKNGSFYTLYDFSLSAGDTMKIFESPFNGYLAFHENDTFDNFLAVVDSTDIINIGGYDLRIIYPSVNFLTGWTFWAPIVERIGELNLPFGAPGILFPEYGGGLRCYQDSLLFHKPYQKDCDYISGILESKSEETFTLHPNPTEGELRVLSSKFPVEMEVFDVFGRQVANFKLKTGNTELSLQGFPAGIYFIRVGDGVTKLLKQ